MRRGFYTDLRESQLTATQMLKTNAYLTQITQKFTDDVRFVHLESCAIRS